MPSEVARLTAFAHGKLNTRLGIHTHNDCGFGVANAVAALEAGASHVQGTINGYGERTGNCNLITIIPILTLKMGYRTIPDDRLDRRVEVDQGAQRAVTEPVASRPGGERRRDQRHLQQRLVGTRDADRDRLGLVLDRVDRTRQLVDAPGERGREVMDDGARGPDLAVLDLVVLEGTQPGGVTEQRGDPGRGARFEAAVVPSRPEALEETT